MGARERVLQRLSRAPGTRVPVPHGHDQWYSMMPQFRCGLAPV